ncbi:hypothetical protein OH799_33410 [Nocardia sp. NBC_00881]|uniref:hypothetical protein n=1 Tax=Nocardia sp. NBC_00881 TaxID=2975995 RepID=UPI0038698205|nr:hypothetical protein OH799_33410 [Nocardia sp. NBC_00881]
MTSNSLDDMAMRWTELSNDVGSGKLSLADGVAIACAQACADAFGRVRGIRAEVTKAGTLGPLGGRLKSGYDLAQKYNGKLIELDLILDSHDRILTNMFATLVAAGKAYEGAEVDSVTGFDLITPSGGFKKDNPDKYEIEMTKGALSTESGVAPMFPEASSIAFGGEFEGPGDDGYWDVDPENAYTLTRSELHDLGQAIPGVLQPLLDFSARWNWVADEVDDVMGALNTALSIATDGDHWKCGWNSPAADRAKKATFDYITESFRLTGGIRVVADNLSYTSEWLNNTRWLMPATPQPDLVDHNGYESAIESGEEAAARVLFHARAHFARHYVPGVVVSASKMPILPEPMSPVVDPDKDPEPPGPEWPPLGPGGTTGSGPGWTAATSGAGAVGDMGGYPDGGLGAGYGDGPRSADGINSGASALGQLSSLGSDAVSGLQGAASVAKEAAAGSRSTLPASLSNAPGAAHKPGMTATGSLGAGSPSAAGGIGPGGPGLSANTVRNEASRLFPRASIPVGTGLGAMPTAGMPPMGGYPPGAPGLGQGGRQDGNKYERPEHLNSAEHMNEALGESQFATRPVLEQ